MEGVGVDLNEKGSVMTRSELEEQRRKRGECLRCGRKCFQKKLLRMVPITEHGKVLNGRCLNCRPLEVSNDHTVLPAVSRVATREELERFNRSQRNLMGAGGSGHRFSVRAVGNSSTRQGRRMSGGGGGGTDNGGPEHSGPSNGGSLPVGSTASTSLGRNNRAFNGMRTRSVESIEEEETTRNRRASVGPVPGSRPGGRGASFGNGAGGGGAPSSTVRTGNGSSSGNTQSIRSMGSQGSSGMHTRQPSNGPNSMTSAVVGASAANMLASQYRNSHPNSQRSNSDYHQPLAPAPSDPHHMYHHMPPVNEGTRHPQSDYHGMGSPPLSAPEAAPDGDRSILNRGGIITFRNDHNAMPGPGDGGPPSTAVPAESQRTFSSVSSMEDGDQYSRRNGSSPQIDSSRRSSVDNYGDNVDGSGNYSPDNSVDRDQTLDDNDEATMLSLRDPNTTFEDIIHVIGEHKAKSIVLQEAFRAFSDLRLTPGERTAAASIGGLAAIMDGMKAHQHHPGVQANAFRALWNLSASSENQLAIGEAGGVDEILKAMAEFEGNAAVQETGMAVLSNLAAADANQPLITEKGGVERIVEAMNMHSENVCVQEKGCVALTNLASHDSAVKITIAKAGGADAIVVGMVMHPGDADLQQKALRALRNLCANEEENKIIVANVGGIDAVIGAMQVHRDDPDIQEAGAWTLSNLAVNTDNKAIIGESGGIDVIIRAMWVHSEHVGVQEWACRALWALSVDSNNKNIVTEVGGISAVVNAMQAHVGAATVQEKGCGVLSNLAANDDNNKVRIVEEEALDAIVMAMVLHSENALVQERACTVLKKLAFGPNLKCMQAANVASLMSAAGDRFPEKCRDKAREVIALL